jgi:zinc transporter ZupT
MVAVFPAILASMLLPLLASRQVSDTVLGGAAGCLIVLSLLGIVLVARRRDRCA